MRQTALSTGVGFWTPTVVVRTWRTQRPWHVFQVNLPKKFEFGWNQKRTLRRLRGRPSLNWTPYWVLVAHLMRVSVVWESADRTSLDEPFHLLKKSKTSGRPAASIRLHRNFGFPDAMVKHKSSSFGGRIAGTEKLWSGPDLSAPRQRALEVGQSAIFTGFCWTLGFEVAAFFAWLEGWFGFIFHHPPRDIPAPKFSSSKEVFF